MKVPVACPNCAKIYQLPESNLGKRARCKKCATEFFAKATSSEPASAPAPAKPVSVESAPPVQNHPTIAAPVDEPPRIESTPIPPAAPAPAPAVSVACPTCGHGYALVEAMIGKRARCKGCGEVFRVPQPPDEPVQPMDAPVKGTLVMDVLIDDDIDEYPFTPFQTRPGATDADRSSGEPGARLRRSLPYLVGVATAIPAFWLTWWLTSSWFASRIEVPTAAAEVASDEKPRPRTLKGAKGGEATDRKQLVEELVGIHEKIVKALEAIEDPLLVDRNLATLRTLEEERDEQVGRIAVLPPLDLQNEAKFIQENGARLRELLERESAELKRIAEFVDNPKAIAAQISQIHQAIAELHLGARSAAPSS